MDQSIRVERFSPSSKVLFSAQIILLVVLATAPLWAGRADMRLMIEFYCYLALASLWNLLAGYGGMVSVGQQAYVGLGGYMLFSLAIFLGIHPIVAIPLAGVICAVIAIPAAFLLFRLKGAYFAIGSWVLAEVVMLVFANISALGGGSGVSLPISIVKSIASSRSDREMLVYFIALGLVAVILFGIFLILRSKLGVALTAIRDNAEAAGAMGINTTKTKLIIYVAVAFATGMVGALIFLQKVRISPDAAFSINDWTAFVIFIAVIGGIGRIEGPIIGTLIFFILRETLADYGTYYLLALGLVAILIMLYAPKGIWGWVENKTGMQAFPLQRRVVSKQQYSNGESQ